MCYSSGVMVSNSRGVLNPPYSGKSLRVMVTLYLCTFEQSLIHNFATKKDSKSFHFIKEFTKFHILPFQMHNDSSTATTNFDKAELHTQSIDLYSIFNISDIPKITWGFNQFTERDVLEALSSLDSNKASGMDNIPPILLKHCSYMYLSYLFTNCSQPVLTVDTS